MPERGFDDGFWSNPFTMRLPRDAKALLAYLFTNQHCNPAGLYKIAPETIAFETKIPEEDLPNLFELIGEKVKWYPEDSLVWYKNFVKRQAKSPKFLIAVGRCLENIKRKDVVQELIEYNYSIHSISIPYGNSSSSVSVLTCAPAGASKAATATKSLSNTNSGKDKRVKGEKEDKGLAEMLKVYEENIGKLYPIIGEQLRSYRDKYPVKWFEEAVEEAVKLDHCNLKYIEAILKRRDAEVVRQKR